MLKFFSRKRRSTQIAPPAPSNEALRIGNLLDHPELQHVMSLETATTVATPPRATQIAELPPLVEVRFERRQLLEAAA